MARQTFILDRTKDLAAENAELYNPLMTVKARLDTRLMVAHRGDFAFINAQGSRVIEVPVTECEVCHVRLIDSQPIVRCPCCGWVSHRNV